MLATSWATCLPRSSASWPVSLTWSFTWSATGPSFSFSTFVVGMSIPARKPIAMEPMARPSGFSCAMPAPRLATSLTSPVLGVASLTLPAAPVIVSFTEATVPLTFSLARVGTSAL